MTASFVYLPGLQGWINLTHVTDVLERNEELTVYLLPNGSQTNNRQTLTGTDRELFLAALKPHTFPIK